MAEQLAWSAGKPGAESTLLQYAADSAAYSGQLGWSRDLFRQAVTAALRVGEKEIAASCEAAAATGEAFLGNLPQARQHAASAIALSNGRDAEFRAALALARVGETTRAAALADDLAKRFPEDTIVRSNYLPTIRAQIALFHSDPAKAIELLRTAAPYELGVPTPSSFSNNVYSIYIRGEALFVARQGVAAATEFQKLIEARGITVNDPIAALAHLGLARSEWLAGNPQKAKTSYARFLELWKDADPDIPILNQARAEYARLQ